MISKTKRSLTFALATAALTFAIPSAHAQAPRVIKISHQFPAASSEDGDFRDRLVRRFAAEVVTGTLQPSGAVVFVARNRSATEPNGCLVTKVTYTDADGQARSYRP